MSYYYKYSFVSPEPIYATIREELKSYFDTQSIDDLMFPTYTYKCLEKLGRGTYAIHEVLLHIENFEVRLPDNFYAVREAWACSLIEGRTFMLPGAFYSQAISQTTIQLSPIVAGNVPCNNAQCSDPECNGIDCMPEIIQSVYKTTSEALVAYRRTHLLKPGNISVRANCSLDCANFGSSSYDSFDIRDNKFVVNFRCGKVYLIFYATDYDKDSNQLIPDNYRVKEYIEAFIKYKMFETLSNQITDETFNQVQQKMLYYKSLSDEAFILASTELKKQDVHTKFRGIKSLKKRLDMYELSGTNMRRPVKWRRWL